MNVYELAQNVLLFDRQLFKFSAGLSLLSATEIFSTLSVSCNFFLECCISQFINIKKSLRQTSLPQ